MIKIKPVSDRVLVEFLPDDKKTKSGIVLTDELNKDKPRLGVVIAVGESVDPMIEVGKQILFSRAVFNQFESEGKEYYFLIEEDILGVFE